MADPLTHFIAGGVGGVFPDVVLLTFGWRKYWLDEDHSLVRAHRFLHGTGGIATAFIIGAILHIIIDRHTPHRTRP